jgi:hypothetical protein
MKAKPDLGRSLQALREAGVGFRILVTGPVYEAPATGFVRLNDTGPLPFRLERLGLIGNRILWILI